MSRREVGLVVRRSGDLQGVAEVQQRHLVGHRRNLDAEPLDGGCRVLAHRRDHPGDHVAQARDHLPVVLDEAELDVEADVLRQVPHRVVRLGAEHRPDLVDPLEDPDQHLLVELRALGEVRRPAEVVDLEDVGAALGRRLDQLGRGDLGEAGSVEGLAEAAHAGRGQLPLGALQRVPPGDGRVVEQRRQADVQRRSPELHGRGVGVVGQRPDRRLGHLDPAGCLGVGGRDPDDLDRRLLGRYVRRPGRRHDDLRETCSVSNDHERDAAPGGAACAPTPGAGRSSPGSAVGQVGAESAWCHGSPPVDVKPWRCGRGQGRGATTPSPMSHRPLVGTPYARTRLGRGLSGLTGVEDNATATRGRRPWRPESLQPAIGCVVV